MSLSNIRVGRITSSGIVDLTTNGRSKDSYGAPFYSYVQDCRMERFFKHSIEQNAEAKPLQWGKLCELFVHEMLSNDYAMHSEQTFVHPDYPEWVGSPDGSIIVDGKTETITDIKCPLTRKGFYNLVSELYEFDGLTVTKKENVNHNDVIQSIRKNSKEGEKYYWQLVSNACILNAKFAELIVFMPYYDEVEKIKIYNSELIGPYWLIEISSIEELPYLYPESGIENINIIRFEVPEEDKQFLTERVIKAIELINE